MIGLLYYNLERRTLGRMLRVWLYYGISLLLVAVYTWGLLRIDKWWADGLWVLLFTGVIAYIPLKKLHLPFKRAFLPVVGAVLVGVAVALGCVSLAFLRPLHMLLVPVMAVLAGQLMASLTATLQCYVWSLRHTHEHYCYMVANGATHWEAIFPSVKRSMRAAINPLLRDMTSPVLVVPPMLFCGFLIAGMQPVAALAFILIIVVVSLIASVLASMVALALIDRLLFDRSGRFLL
jgi:putative ABC transport system permease protein